MSRRRSSSGSCSRSTARFDAADAACRLDAVEVREDEVHEDDVGYELCRQRHCVASGRRPCEHADVLVQLPEGAKAAANDRVVVDDSGRGRSPLDLEQPMLAFQALEDVQPPVTESHSVVREAARDVRDENLAPGCLARDT